MSYMSRLHHDNVSCMQPFILLFFIKFIINKYFCIIIYLSIFNII